MRKQTKTLVSIFALALAGTTVGGGVYLAQQNEGASASVQDTVSAQTQLLYAEIAKGDTDYTDVKTLAVDTVPDKDDLKFLDACRAEHVEGDVTRPISLALAENIADCTIEKDAADDQKRALTGLLIGFVVLSIFMGDLYMVRALGQNMNRQAEKAKRQKNKPQNPKP